MDQSFDVIVIGAGPAGEVAAGRITERSDKSVAIVERELVGGECSFYACMPSKALLRPSEILHEIGRVPGAAEAVGGDLDVAAALARRDEVIHDLDDSGQLPWLESKGITLVRGAARLDGERRVRVGEDVLVAEEAIIIATGSGAAMPPIPGLADVGAWSNREITTAKEVPGRLLVLGGGYVGAEMATAWSSFGARVTLVEGAERLLGREEDFASDLIHEALTERGVDVRLGVKVTEVRREGETVTLVLDSGETLDGDRLLVAVGRTPHTDELGLESVGLEPAKTIDVDDHLQVAGRPWLYAIGDVNGRSLLTHSGKYQARIAVDHLLGDSAASATFDTFGAPHVVFTDPQIAGVGLTAAQARDRGVDVEVVDLETESTAGASFVGKGGPGTTRFVVDAAREVLVGVTFSGPEVNDFLQAATIAVAGQIPLSTLAHAFAPFPTRSELWLNFLTAYEQQRGVTVHATPLRMEAAS